MTTPLSDIADRRSGPSAGNGHRPPRHASGTERTDQDRIRSRGRRLVGCWQLGLGILVLVGLIACWPLGADATVTWGVLVVGALGGVAGSLVHTITVFSSRVGQSTFEATYTWWYILRPFAAALLAVLFVAAVYSGLVTNLESGPTAVVPVVAGGLAGLFTDTVLQTLRALLGATSTELEASKQQAPLAPAARPKDTDEAQ